MADLKTTVKASMDAKVTVEKTKIYNSTQDVLDNFERCVFDDNALCIGDMKFENVQLRPLGFYKTKVEIELVLLIKQYERTDIDNLMHSIEKQLYTEVPAQDGDMILARVNNWTEERKLTDKVSYFIATLEIWYFRAL